MAIEHSSIDDPEIHEVKGISTAAANSVLVSDGLGSGTWQVGGPIPNSTETVEAGDLVVSDGLGGHTWRKDRGWGQYQDSLTTVGTPLLTLSPDVRTKFTCDGGTLTLEDPSSDQVNPLWNVTTNKIEPIAQNDLYSIRIQFYAEDYSGTSPRIEMALDIAGAVGEIVWDTAALYKSGGVVRTTMAFPVFTGDTFLANGGEIYLTYQGTGTCKIYKTSILVVREQKSYL